MIVIAHGGLLFALVALVLVNVASAQYTADLNIKQSDPHRGGTPVKKPIALDATSNHTSPSGAPLIKVGGAGGDAGGLPAGTSSQRSLAEERKRSQQESEL